MQVLPPYQIGDICRIWLPWLRIYANELKFKKNVFILHEYYNCGERSPV